MGRAQLKHTPDVAASRRAVEREVAHEDRVAEAILDMAFDYDDGNPVVGIRNAMIAGIVLWGILAVGALLLV
jgi:hypothetical protein